MVLNWELVIELFCKSVAERIDPASNRELLKKVMLFAVIEPERMEIIEPVPHKKSEKLVFDMIRFEFIMSRTKPRLYNLLSS